jgi:hypothetical protein
MKTITIEGDPESIGAIMVSKAIPYTEHETVRIESTDQGGFATRTIFRIVDAGDEGNELQFE